MYCQYWGEKKVEMKLNTKIGKLSAVSTMKLLLAEWKYRVQLGVLIVRESYITYDTKHTLETGIQVHMKCPKTFL